MVKTRLQGQSAAAGAAVRYNGPIGMYSTFHHFLSPVHAFSCLVHFKLAFQHVLFRSNIHKYYLFNADCFKKIVRAEGWRGLYGGLKPNLIGMCSLPTTRLEVSYHAIFFTNSFPLVGVAPEKALKLTANDLFREAFTKRNGNGKITLFQEMTSGALAGFIQVAVTNPMEIVKLRMQLQVSKMDCFLSQFSL